MYTRRSLAIGFLATCLLPAQDAQPSIQVAGDVKQPLTLTADDLAKMPRATVRTMNNGMETVYEGVWLHEVLQKAGVPQGNELRGKALSTYVLAQAQDGYQVVFSLGELDPAFIDNEILLAVPNTEVALHLARELEVGIDELFSLKEAAATSPESLAAEVLSASAPEKGQPVRICPIGSRWVSLPVTASPTSCQRPMESSIEVREKWTGGSVGVRTGT
jgi:hypothetical protein